MDLAIVPTSWAHQHRSERSDTRADDHGAHDGKAPTVVPEDGRGSPRAWIDSAPKSFIAPPPDRPWRKGFGWRPAASTVAEARSTGPMSAASDSPDEELIP
jgi:hypothetical protein